MFKWLNKPQKELEESIKDLRFELRSKDSIIADYKDQIRLLKRKLDDSYLDPVKEAKHIKNFAVNWKALVLVSIERKDNQTIICYFNLKKDFEELYLDIDLEGHRELVNQFNEAIK